MDVAHHNLFAKARKSPQTGKKIYFYKDDQNNEVVVASYMMKSNYVKKEKKRTLEKGKLEPRIMGEGQHAKIFTRYNPNAEIVRKEFKNRYGDPLNPYRLNTLIRLNVDKTFHSLNLASHICLPFQIHGKPNFIYMKKVPGVSLEELAIDDQPIAVTKHVIMSLLDAIVKLADHEDLRIVHTDIHAGNIIRTETRLVLIDFDECVSVIDKYTPKMIANPDFIEKPTPDDYLIKGYDDSTPQYIPAPMTTWEENFYQTKEIFEGLKEKSIENYKALFQMNGKSLFDDETFNMADDSDQKMVFIVNIKPRDSEEL